jgi:two-component system response regulator GlrR
MSALPVTRSEDRPSAGAIVTANPTMLRVVENCRRMAKTPYPVLLQGETGTGKELLAREIHITSGRRGAFVPVNCGALPENLFEAELFGARRGAYTGLDSDRRGLFRMADGGTLFLDEIGEMSGPVQSKLLRILQDGEVRAVGATVSDPTDVRVVLATHRDLGRMVEEQAFRMDLYYRINTFQVKIPALRERPEDIRVLLVRAVAEAARHQQVPVPQISEKVFELALHYPWPGNVREILHAAASAVLSARDGMLSVADFAMLDRRGRVPGKNGLDRPFFEALADFERGYLATLLGEVNGNLSQAAKKAQLSRSALRAKARQYGLLGEPATGPAKRNRVRWARQT